MLIQEDLKGTHTINMLDMHNDFTIYFFWMLYSKLSSFRETKLMEVLKHALNGNGIKRIKTTTCEKQKNR